MDRKHNPNDLISIRVKVKQVTENDEGKITYRVKPIAGNAYESMEVPEEDILGSYEVTKDV